MNEVPHMLLPNSVKSSWESLKNGCYILEIHFKSNIKEKQQKSAIDPRFK
jgi:hypothetical protein